MICEGLSYRKLLYAVKSLKGYKTQKCLTQKVYLWCLVMKQGNI